MKKYFLLLLVIPMILMLVNCGGNVVTNSYKALYTIGTAYNGSMKAVNDLYKDGKITEDQKVAIEVTAGKVYASYQVATSALEVYKVTESSVDEDKLVVALLEVQTAWDGLSGILDMFLPKASDPLKLEVK
jgi:hypothetical protein